MGDDVAVEVRHQQLNLGLGEGAHDGKAGVGEDDLDGDVLGGLLDGAHVDLGVRGAEVHANRSELTLRELLFEVSHGAFQEVVLQGAHDNVEALGGELEDERTAEARRATAHKGPRRVVLLLEVLLRKNVGKENGN